MVLNNLNIPNFDDLETTGIITLKGETKQFKYKEECFSLEYSQIISKLTGEINFITKLEFNPTKFFNGHNIYNSDVEEVKDFLKIIQKKLLENDVVLDLSQARIKEIELNTTFIQDFEELSEVLTLIGRANHTGALSIYSFLEEFSPKELKKDRTLYLNKRITSNYKKTLGKIIKIYDKSFEVLTKDKIITDKKLTRVEILLGRDYYRNTLEKYNLSNSLNDFLNNELIRNLFINGIKKEIGIKPLKELEIIKKNLNYNFNNFRRNEKFKKVEREKLKKARKDIPTIYKEERGVFEYLRKECWIFDYSFLLEVVRENVDTKNKKNYFNQISKKYMNINNLKIYHNFLSSVELV